MKLSEVELPSNRKFGFFFAAVFGVAGIYFLNESSSALSYTLFGLSVLFTVVTLVKSELLLPINKLWMRLGLLIGMIVSPIVLGIIFFGLFTPISLVMRMFGRDELRLRLKHRQSYWKQRDLRAASFEAFKHQF